MERLVAGRELDMMVAERVIGWARRSSPAGPVLVPPGSDPERDFASWEPVGGVIVPVRGMPREVEDAGMEGTFRRYMRDVLPHYSSRIEDAWLVVEVFDRRGWTVLVQNSMVDRGWRSCARRDAGDAVIEGGAASAPLAICRLALKAVTTP